MDKREYRTSDQEVSQLKRREFLIYSALGIAGLTVYPFTRTEANNGFPILLAVEKLARATDCTTLADDILTYIRRRDVLISTFLEVSRINRRMAEDPVGRFTDLSHSTVYSPETGYFFYTARSEDGINSCAAFFDKKRASGSQRISLIEGPTLFGIGEAAQELADRYSSGWARRVFLPREKIKDGTGGWQISYSTPDVYTSDEGTVEATYYTEGDGRGMVRVRAIREGGHLLGGGDYPLTIHTA
ncbi:MAG: hypothetical protein AB1489_17820 [Acidobacteriota bacterium]